MWKAASRYSQKYKANINKKRGNPFFIFLGLGLYNRDIKNLIWKETALSIK